QLIGFLEQQQTQLDAELKALPPQEKKAAEGAVDALRPRLAVLRRGDNPPPKPQPAPLGSPLLGSPPAPAPGITNAAIEVKWGGSSKAGRVAQVRSQPGLSVSMFLSNPFAPIPLSPKRARGRAKDLTISQ